MNPIIAIMLMLAISVPGRPSVGEISLVGTWKFVPEKSTEIATWKGRMPEVTISSAGGNISVIHGWLERGKIAYADTFSFRSGGKAVRSTVRSVIWPDNWFMGVLASAGDTRTVSGAWREPGLALRVVTREPVRTSQGKTAVITTRDYVLGKDGKTMTLTERRSSRRTPVVLVFVQKEVAP